MGDEMKEQLGRLLGIPVLDETENLRPPCITISLYAEAPIIFGDGAAEAWGASYQADIWAERKSRMMELKEELRKWAEGRHTAPSISYGYEPEAKLYRATLTFEALKGEWE